jgi:hypothetical protein
MCNNCGKYDEFDHCDWCGFQCDSEIGNDIFLENWRIKNLCCPECSEKYGILDMWIAWSEFKTPDHRLKEIIELFIQSVIALSINGISDENIRSLTANEVIEKGTILLKQKALA